MEKKINKILYILIALMMILISNYLVINEVFSNFLEKSEIMPFDTNIATKMPTTVAEENGLYTRYETLGDSINRDTQEWFKVLLKSDVIVKFQYYNQDSETSRLSLYVNEIQIDNNEVFLKEDKYKINFHIFEDILVIEHKKENNRLPFIAIVNLESGEVRYLSNDFDFYINGVNVDHDGIRVSYSREQDKLDYYIESNALKLPFAVNGEQVVINVCSKNTWSEELYKLESVAYDLVYRFDKDGLNINFPVKENIVDFNNYLKPYLRHFNTICK